MSVEPELLQMFTDTITITPLSSKGLYGREEFLDADARTVPCFIERSPRLVQALDGRQVIASATIYVDDVDVRPTDRVLYADGTRAKIESIFTPRDEAGPHHAELAVT